MIIPLLRTRGGGRVRGRENVVGRVGAGVLRQKKKGKKRKNVQMSR